MRAGMPTAHRRKALSMSLTRSLVPAAKSAPLAVLLLLGLSGGAWAQIVPLFGNAGPFLNGADFSLADVAARTLLEPKPASRGTAASWSNAASGNSGKLTMGRAYQMQGNECRAVSWHEVFKAGSQRTVQLETCRISGVWKLM